MGLAAEALDFDEQAYLEGELRADRKHEWLDGHAIAMAGASRNHARLVANASGELYAHLRQSPCELFTSDMKVKAGKNFFYPDLLVVCEETSDNPYFSESPVLIVEVLSPATRKIDKVRKRRAYQSLPSLREYVLLEQDVVEIEVSRREEQWLPAYYFLGDEVVFSSLDLRLPVEALYARVDNESMREWLREQAAH